MQRSSVSRSICLYVLLSVLAVMVVSCAKPKAPMTPAQYEAEANKRWPKSEVLQGYSKAIEEYNSGNIEGGIKLVEELIDEPLQIAPDSVLSDNDLYYDVYMIGRVVPVIGRMRDIITLNMEYASNLSKSGKYKDALYAYALNLNIATQMMNIRPVEISTVIQASSKWATAWEQIRKVLQEKGDTERAKLAMEQMTIEDKFYDQDIYKLMTKNIQEMDQEVQGRNISRTRVKQQAGLRKLVDEWNKEVNSTESRKLLVDILADID